MLRTYDAARGTVASIIGRTGRGRALALIAILLTAGCSGYFWTAPKSWALKGQLQSVPESSPHGTLVLERNSKSIFILVDGKAAFRSVEGNSATFRLSPGRHEVIARYTATEGNNAVVAGPLNRSLEIAAGQRVALGVTYTGSGIRFASP
jgi:hypothetical protein